MKQFFSIIVTILPILWILSISGTFAARNKGCVKGYILPEKWQNVSTKNVKLCPSWEAPSLYPPRLIRQIVPENATWNIANNAEYPWVRLIHGMQPVHNETEFLVRVELASPNSSYTYYMMHFDVTDEEISEQPWHIHATDNSTTSPTQLPVSTSTSAELGVTATLMPMPWQSYGSQNVKLLPGWTETLNQTIKQMMVPETGSKLTQHAVRVYPGMQKLVEEDGEQAMHARVFLKDAVDHVTIYFDF